jgi:small nuclear ribonucleoprotein (snRNP)-like protein
MKKYIVIEEEVLVRLVSGKYVEGSLHRDKWTGMITFNAYNRLPRKRQKDELLKKTPWGWLKASIERVKRYSSVPKDLSLEEKMAIFDEENELIKQALIENYIIESV